MACDAADRAGSIFARLSTLDARQRSENLSSCLSRGKALRTFMRIETSCQLS
jgi:hypothetical protein